MRSHSPQRRSMILVFLVVTALLATDVNAQGPTALALNVLEGQKPQDSRLGELRTLNSYFPFQAVDDPDRWAQRQREIRRRILVSQGLWPLPTKTPLDPVIHGRVERDDYVVDRVFFQSAPGHFVTGSLYRPKQPPVEKMPAILCPHGHWRDGRFYDAGEQTIRAEIESGAEKFATGGRYVIQARAVQLARMGCVVFVYDMTGYADSIQIQHRPNRWGHLDRPTDWGFMSVQADLRLQNMMGLQTWNSIRAIDFVLQLPDVDPTRIGVTGASGGGTQSMILSAIDDRIAASMPCVMVSTAMQGGCTCENAPLLRIDQGNIDIAAATAPRPLGLTAADDWTIELETKGYPDLVRLYEMLGHADHLTAVFHTQFKHNYNAVNRAVMYSFFNRHFELGWDEPIVERDYVPLTREEATVWTDQYPAPSGEQVGDSHEVRLLRMATADSQRQMEQRIPKSPRDLDAYREVVGGGWQTILNRSLADVRKVEFIETTSTNMETNGGTVTITGGTLKHVPADEQLPVVQVSSRQSPRGWIVWVSDQGKTGLFEGDRLDASVQKFVDRGYTVIAADLFQQGEFLEPDTRPLKSQRMWYQGDGSQGWHRFSGYTFGYNHCLLVHRVHDVLTLIRHAQSQSATVHVVGIGEHAGIWAIAAAGQSDDVLTHTLVHVGEFRFSDTPSHDDPMFVPGAVKYLDVDGLVSLMAPRKLTIIGNSDLPITRQVYEASGARNAITINEDFQFEEFF